MCKSVCSSGSDSDVTECNNSNLEYKMYQSVLQTFGRDPAYLYMPDIETDDAYSGANEETDVDDYKITGEAYDMTPAPEQELSAEFRCGDARVEANAD